MAARNLIPTVVENGARCARASEREGQREREREVGRERARGGERERARERESEGGGERELRVPAVRGGDLALGSSGSAARETG